MEAINSAITKFRNLPRKKKIVLVLIVIVVIVYLFDVIMSYSKQHYKNIENKPKKSSNIEKLKSSVEVETESSEETIIKAGGVTLHTQKVNATLYFAHWCGHCKQFISSTWGKVKEKFEDHPDINLNDMDCTNIKTQISSPAGMPIKGFPTVILNFKNAEGEYVEEEYSGSRAYEAFSTYLESLTNGGGEENMGEMEESA